MKYTITAINVYTLEDIIEEAAYSELDKDLIVEAFRSDYPEAEITIDGENGYDEVYAPKISPYRELGLTWEDFQ